MDLDVDISAKERESLASSHQIADDLIEFGISIREKLGTQGEILKVRRRWCVCETLVLGVSLGVMVKGVSLCLFGCVLPALLG